MIPIEGHKCTLLLLLIIVIVIVFIIIIIVTIVIIVFIDYYYYHWSLLLLSIDAKMCFVRGKPDPHFSTHWNSLLACWVAKFYEPSEINTNGRFMSNLSNLLY